ncbi:S-adenosyl-L-methionine-dependent methyltransferase [Phascolomyces articulosus]|uniref:S-adenosyl-L-methionine-dependent methyltransferase n=1 Tax=Phascolomyces articulosus TaxID=60185 RepID=A0AAD5PBE8_9FUNG|nr:S-adenosyl-L-methionine-dependent methyltransferase [Phascolomyces articulosus]
MTLNIDEQPPAHANENEGNDYKDQSRKYHENVNAAYVLPEDEMENDRLYMQHYALKLAFGANFDSPIEEELEQGITVLDSGCGPGTWTLDMAQQYPQSKFYGLDISSVFPTEIKPSNTEFQLHNITEPAPFPENTFDYVHQRLLVMGLRNEEWKKVISNYLQVLKSNGYFEFTECTTDLVNGGPKMTLLMDCMKTIATMKDLHIEVYRDFASYFEEAGAINVRSRQLIAPFNHTNKVGELLWKDYCMMFTALKPIVAKTHPELASEEAYAKFMEETGEECKEYKTHLIFSRCYGQKP